MKTPQEILRESIAKSGLTYTQLGRRLGYKNAYQAVHNLVTGARKFTPQLQDRISDVLELPRGHFESPDLTERRDRYIRATFKQFLATETARELDQDTLDTIRRMKFTVDKLPTVALYQRVAIALKSDQQYTFEELAEAEKRNVELDRYNAGKTAKRPRLRALDDED